MSRGPRAPGRLDPVSRPEAGKAGLSRLTDLRRTRGPHETDQSASTSNLGGGTDCVTSGSLRVRAVPVRVDERVQYAVAVDGEGEVLKLTRVPADVDRHLPAGIRAVVDKLDAVVGVFALHQRDRVLHDAHRVRWVSYRAARTTARDLPQV